MEKPFKTTDKLRFLDKEIFQALFDNLAAKGQPDLVDSAREELDEFLEQEQPPLRLTGGRQRRYKFDLTQPDITDKQFISAIIFELDHGLELTAENLNESFREYDLNIRAAQTSDSIEFVTISKVIATKNLNE